MNTNMLMAADALSDHALLERLPVLAGGERRASAELVAHLAVLDRRPMLYAAGGYSSLFSYCTQALGLSEDAACSRIEAARACRRHPEILELLAGGSLTLTSVRLLGRHLTADNHQTVLARAVQKSRREIEAIVAELAPRPDVPSLVRKLPAAVTGDSVVAPPGQEAPVRQDEAPQAKAALRPVVQLAPARYKVQFTIDEETQDKLRRLQSLLRREIPSGDPGAIFARAVSLLLEDIEKVKLGRTSRPRPQRTIRPRTDEDAAEGALPPRDPSNAVKREVWERDGGRCAYVSPNGRRCGEQVFLEFHHRRPYALRGLATVDNIALRCRVHNRYEARLAFALDVPSVRVNA